MMVYNNVHIIYSFAPYFKCMEPLDAATIIKAQEGNIAAFESIVSAYEQPIYRYVLRVVNSREDAKDLTQEIFLKTFKNIKLFEPTRPFKPWLFKIATNITTDWFRRAYRTAEVYSIDDEKRPFETISDADTYKDIEMSHDIASGLAKIKPSYRTVLTLYYFEHLSYEEMAVIVAVPLNTIKTLLRRAKVALKEQLFTFPSSPDLLL